METRELAGNTLSFVLLAADVTIKLCFAPKTDLNTVLILISEELQFVMTTFKVFTYITLFSILFKKVHKILQAKL